MSAANHDYYEILGVARTASEKEIHDAYRAWVLRVHPDRRSNRSYVAPGAPDIILVNEAWAVLGDPRRRAAYDSAMARERPEKQSRAQADLPPVPNGFRLHPRPAWGFASSDLAYRVADARRGALSLVAESPDLSPLATLAEGDLWLLDLRDLPVRDTDLSFVIRFRRLLVLLLTGSLVTDTGIGVLAALSSLETLHLSETKVTDSGLAALRAHPALAVLDIRNTRVRGEGLRHLAGVPNLRELRVTGAARRSALEVFRQRPEVDLL